MKALLFGSIGTVCDTSALQLQAYNQAFDEHSLDWHWSDDEYRQLLSIAGGLNRLQQFASARSATAPASETLESVHERKRVLYGELLESTPPGARAGVTRLIEDARSAGVALAFVTTTDRHNIEAIAAAAGSGFSLDHFDVVTDRSHVDHEKPDPEAYLRALERLGCSASQAVAIEDTGICVKSACDAGLTCVATPHTFSQGQNFDAAAAVVSSLGSRENPANALGGADVLIDGQVTLASLRALST